MANRPIPQTTAQVPFPTTTRPNVPLPTIVRTNVGGTAYLPQPIVPVPNTTIRLPQPTVQIPQIPTAQTQIRQVRGGDFPAIITNQQPTTIQPAVRPPTITIPPPNAQPIIGPAGIVQPIITMPPGITQQTIINQLPGLPRVDIPTLAIPGVLTVAPPIGLPMIGRFNEPPDRGRVPFPQGPIGNEYYLQADPNPDEFRFQAAPENAHFIQASIETARNLFPSFELYIQAAEADGFLQEHTRRGLYPSYMRDASPFEIYKVYRGNAAAIAREFLDRLIRLVQEFQNENPDGEDHPITLFMQNHGYLYTYIGFIRADHAAGQAQLQNFLLTPENFVASITPDQAILMEAWRLKALQGGVSLLDNSDLLGLRAIRGQYNTGPRDRVEDRSPVLQTIGFEKRRLLDAIRHVADRIRPHPTTLRRRHHRVPQIEIIPITRNYIRYEGENAVNEWGRNINDKGLATNDEMPKPYYMMLYNELRLRGLLDRTRF